MPRKIKNRPEQDLQIAVVRWLRIVAPDLLVFHVPNGGVRSKAEAGIFKAMGVRKGVADLCFVLPPIATFGKAAAAFIELKAPGTGHRKPDANQAAFAADCKRDGAPYAVCDSLEQVEATLTGWGVQLRGRAV